MQSVRPRSQGVPLSTELIGKRLVDESTGIFWEVAVFRHLPLVVPFNEHRGHEARGTILQSSQAALRDQLEG